MEIIKLIPPFVIPSLLLFVWILKLIAICHAIKWLRNWGECYKHRLKANLPETKADYYALFEKCHGDFLPHGIKDFRLHQRTESAKAKKSCTYPFLWLYREWFFRFNRLILITSIYLFFVSGSFDHDTTSFHSLVLYLLAVLVLVINFLPFIEAVYSYSILESYAVSFHMQIPESKRQADESSLLNKLRRCIFGRINRTSLLSELRVFILKVLATVGAGATTFYVAHFKYRSFKGVLGPNTTDFWSRLKVYWQGIYFTATTFATVGYGDIVPVNGKGQLIAFLIEAQAFSLVIIVFAALQGSRSRSSAEPK